MPSWPETVSQGLMLFDDYDFQNYKGVKPTVDAFVNKHKDEIEQHGLLNEVILCQKKENKNRYLSSFYLKSSEK